MKIKNFSISVFLLICIFFFSCNSIPKVQEANGVKEITSNTVALDDGSQLKMAKSVEEKTTIILVRHAEKRKDSKDPDLTMEGKMRAEKLSNILKTLELDHVFSSPYKRTIQTSEPTALAKQLDIENYDPRDMDNFGNTLLEKYSGKKILVVGHSNTTPKLLNYLLGETVVKSIPETDYDNLFVVSLFPNKEPKAILLKF